MKLPHNGGYRYRTRSRRRRRSHSSRSKYNRSRRSRMSSRGLSLASGRTYSGGNSIFDGVPTGYSIFGTQQETLNGGLANPPPVHPYNSCIN